MNISAWPDETAQLTLISPQTAIQCTKSLTLSQLEVECTESRYAFACNGATSVNSVMTFNNCTANLKAKKGLFKGFKDLLTVKCGLNYDEYEDQRIAYGKQERQLTQKEKPCLAIPIVNTDMIIPIDTRNETWTWLAERTKPVMAGEDEQADDDTSAIGSDEEESAPMIEDEQPTMESEEVAMVETEPVAEEEEKKEEEEDRIFDVPEQRPQFNGTNDELSKFLSETIQYPAIAHENGIQGRVYVSFVVEKDGSVSNIKVVRPIDPSLNKEAVRVIQASSGRWKPAMQRGVPVRSTYTMPVNFRLTAATN